MRRLQSGAPSLLFRSGQWVGLATPWPPKFVSRPSYGLLGTRDFSRQSSIHTTLRPPSFHKFYCYSWYYFYPLLQLLAMCLARLHTKSLRAKEHAGPEWETWDAQRRCVACTQVLSNNLVHSGAQRKIHVNWKISRSRTCPGNYEARQDYGRKIVRRMIWLEIMNIANALVLSRLSL